MSSTTFFVLLSLVSIIGTTGGQTSPERQQTLVLVTSASYDKSFNELRAGLKAGTDYASYVRDIMQQANDVLRKMDLHIRLVESIERTTGLMKSEYWSNGEVWEDTQRATTDSRALFRVILSGHLYFSSANLPVIITEKEDVCSASLTVVNVRRPKVSGEEVDQMLDDQTVVHHVVRGILSSLGVKKGDECSCPSSCLLDQDSDSLTIPACGQSLHRLYNFTCLTTRWHSHDSKVPICGNGIVENMTSTSGFPNESCDCPSSQKDCECNLKVCKPCSQVACDRGGGMNVLTLLLLVLAIVVVIGVIGYAVFVLLKKKGMIPQMKTATAAQSTAPTPDVTSTDKSTGATV